MGELRLEVAEWSDASRWRWVLTDAGGRFLADHEVRLDRACWQFEAFADLRGYLQWNAAPDRRIAHEAAIVEQVGAWVGEQVFGPIGAALVRARPAVVRVVVPERARELVFRPLEMAHVGGRPLAVQNVTLVMQPASTDNAAGLGVGGTPLAGTAGARLRVLGLFSVPVDGRPLNLRRERYALVRLFEQIAALGRAVDVRVLQYGVTRQRLAEVLEEAEGWDIVHISGHGAPGELLLETEEGFQDPVGAEALADLLDLARERLGLVSVSACWSGALTAAEQRRLLGLPTRQDAADNERGLPALDEDLVVERPEPADGQGPVEALATELVDRLGCAVLAMRYPVVDDFAIALAERLYELLADKGQPLARAVGMALKDVLPAVPTPSCPALSVATPALFGAGAVDLRLMAPARTGPVSFDRGVLKLAGFPPQPDRFVGRVAVMAQASAVLAPRSGISGVVLYGMPGAGKTACALELAYTHEHAFEVLVWFKAPDEGRDITSALTEFLLELERKIPGLRLAHLLEDQTRLRAELPELNEFAEHTRVLVVVDNAESLLTESGQWRDPHWGMVLDALVGQAGFGRLIITSRRKPAGLDAGMRVESIDALSLDEALLLARDLPNLHALIEGDLPGVDRETIRHLAVGVLEVAQGHPKLLELADGQAAHPDQLTALVQAGGQAWQNTGGLPDGFFTTGDPTASGTDYLHVLQAWTTAITATLPPPARDLFGLICCLEEPDRTRPILDGNWADLWQRLERTGGPSDLDVGMRVLAELGLVSIHPGTGESDASYGVHPGVATAGRDDAGPAFQEAVDTELAAYWTTLAEYALDREGQQDTGGLVVRAGLAAAPYLLRLSDWGTALGLLQGVLYRDGSRATVAAILPALHQILTAVSGTGNEPAAVGVLAKALRVVDPAAAEQHTRGVLEAALARHDYRTASTAAGDLARYCMESGRLEQALTLADDKIDYTRRAGLGPWTQLNGEAQRLQVLVTRGDAEQVLAEVGRLRARMDTLSTTSDLPEAVEPWNVREVLLGTGHVAALQLERWEEALELNAAVTASRRARGASEAEIARTRFNAYFPLLRLGRVGEALVLLRECRDVFDRTNDVHALGKVLSALADVEDKRGHGSVAIGLEQDALRYSYLVGDVTAITASHHNLGDYLRLHATDTGLAGGAAAHHLAAALIRAVTGGQGLDDSLRTLAADLRVLGDAAALPGDVRELCKRVGQVPGVSLDRLLTALTSDPDTAQPVLEQLIAQARTQAATTPTPMPLAEFLARWDPVISALAAADHGDTTAHTALSEYLARYADSPGWASLAGVLQRIAGGDRGEDLSAGLDAIDTAILTRTLGVLDGHIDLPPHLWHAMNLGPLLMHLVAAAHGDTKSTPHARQRIDDLASDPQSSGLARVLEGVLDGDRDPAIIENLDDPTQRAVVFTVLHHIGADPPENP